MSATEDELRVLQFLDRTNDLRRFFRARQRRSPFGLSVSDIYTNKMGFLELRFSYRVLRRVHNRSVAFRATLYVNETELGAFWARWERGAIVATGPLSRSTNSIVQYDDFIDASGINK